MTRAKVTAAGQTNRETNKQRNKQTDIENYNIDYAFIISFHFISFYSQNTNDCTRSSLPLTERVYIIYILFNWFRCITLPMCIHYSSGLMLVASAVDLFCGNDRYWTSIFSVCFRSSFEWSCLRNWAVVSRLFGVGLLLLRFAICLRSYKTGSMSFHLFFCTHH